MFTHVLELAEANANVWANMHAPRVRALVHVESLEVSQVRRRDLPITSTVNTLWVSAKTGESGLSHLIPKSL